jgi:hypothetical protein
LAAGPTVMHQHLRRRPGNGASRRGKRAGRQDRTDSKRDDRKEIAVLLLGTLVKPNKQWPRLNECIRLFWSFTPRMAPHNNQYGFCEGKSTETAMHTLANIVEENLAKVYFTGPRFSKLLLNLYLTKLVFIFLFFNFILLRIRSNCCKIKVF